MTVWNIVKIISKKASLNSTFPLLAQEKITHERIQTIPRSLWSLCPAYGRKESFFGADVKKTDRWLSTSFKIKTNKIEIKQVEVWSTNEHERFIVEASEDIPKQKRLGKKNKPGRLFFQFYEWSLLK